MKSLAVLVGGSALLWAALLYPGWLWWGETALVHSLVAWALCVLPGVATMIWATRHDVSPETRVLAVLAGSGVRLMTALGGGFVLTELFPEAFPKIFWIWVGVFYLVLLTFEVLLLVRRQQNSPSVP